MPFIGAKDLHFVLGLRGGISFWWSAGERQMQILRPKKRAQNDGAVAWEDEPQSNF